jgi:hypothetical protein
MTNPAPSCLIMMQSPLPSVLAALILVLEAERADGSAPELVRAKEPDLFR